MSAVVLAGGGLANALIALRLRVERPDVDVTIVEGAERIGGNHVWCFHDADLTSEQHEWMRPLVACSWPRHEVRFPRRVRRIERPYHAVTSERLHATVMETLGDRVRLGKTIRDLGPTHVELVDGTRWEADAVIDGRGVREFGTLELAYQKFVGCELILENDHGLDGPILMDATVEQRDGFRFMYTLPLDARRVLIEDTRYSDGPELDRIDMRVAIDRYAAARVDRHANRT